MKRARDWDNRLYRQKDEDKVPYKPIDGLHDKEYEAARQDVPKTATNTVTQPEIIDRVSHRTGIPRSAVQAVTYAIEDELIKAYLETKYVRFGEFGTFTPKLSKWRSLWWNTEKKCHYRAYAYVFKFRPGLNMRKKHTETLDKIRCKEWFPGIPRKKDINK